MKFDAEDIDEVALAADIFSKAVAQGCTNKAAKMEQIQRTANAELRYSAGSNVSCYRELLSIIGEEKYEQPILEYIRRYSFNAMYISFEKRAISNHKTPDEIEQIAALQSLELEQIRKGAYENAHVVSEPIRIMIDSLSSTISDCLRRTLVFNESQEEKNPDKIVELLVGSLHSVDRSFAESALTIYPGEDKEYIYGSEIKSARRLMESIMSIVLRKIPIRDKLMKKVLNSLVEYMNKKISGERMAAMKNHDARTDRANLERIAISRMALANAFDDFICYLKMSKIGNLLKYITPTKHGKAPDSELSLPWDRVYLIEQTEHAQIIYESIGYLGFSSMHLHSDVHETSDVFRCFVDKNGNIAPSRASISMPLDTQSYANNNDIDPQEVAQTFSAIREMSSAFSAKIIDCWQEFPSLFGALGHLNILLLEKKKDGMLIYITPIDAEKVRAILPQSVEHPFDQTVFEKLNMNLQMELMCFFVPATQILPEASIEEEQTESDDLQKHQRALFHAHFPRGIKNYQHMLRILHNMGVTETTQGKGSHTSLHLGHKRATISCKIRGSTERIQPSVTLEILRELGIDLDAFLEHALIP